LNDGRGSGSAKGGTTVGKLGKLGKLGGPGNSTSRLARELKEPCRVELASLDPCADITRLAIHEMLSAIHLGWGGCRVLPPSDSATLLLTRGTAAPKAGAFACVSSCASIGPSREVVCRERALVGAVDKFSMDNGGTLKHCGEQKLGLGRDGESSCRDCKPCTEISSRSGPTDLVRRVVKGGMQGAMSDSWKPGCGGPLTSTGGVKSVFS